jgi:hypothetical protein
VPVAAISEQFELSTEQMEKPQSGFSISSIFFSFLSDFSVDFLIFIVVLISCCDYFSAILSPRELFYSGAAQRSFFTGAFNLCCEKLLQKKWAGLGF